MTPALLALQLALAIDGDTLRMGRETVRLCGVRVPELHEPGGTEAKRFLERYLAGKRIQCVPVGLGSVCDGRSPKRSHGRIVAQCYADGDDLVRALIEAGHGLEWKRFSGGWYGRE